MNPNEPQPGADPAPTDPAPTDPVPNPAPAPDPSGGLRFGAMSPQAYWRRNIICVLSLLVVWFLVSYGCGILWADKLDEITSPGGGVKLGFWFAQQGSIFVFVALIGIYVVIMNKLDAKFFGKKR